MITTITPPKALVRKLRIAEAVNHLIVTQINANTEFWNMSNEDILAELNADISETLDIFSGNTTLGNALNATQTTLNVLDEKGNPVFTARAPIGPNRTDIVFNGTDFIYVLPEVIEETPES